MNLDGECGVSLQSEPTRGGEPKAVHFDEACFWVELEDGRTLGVPLAWFPRLMNGAPELREKYSVSSSGLHWEELDEDIFIAGLLAGRGDQTRLGRAA